MEKIFPKIHNEGYKFIAISIFMMVTSDSPYPLATLGLAIVCLSLMPKQPRN